MEANGSKPWTILVVDDDDAVHDITTLALRRARFFGLGVELTAARSKQEAIAMMDQLDADRLAVALVDVVMEHDTAGLELVGALRERFGSPLQIVIRTGQPGVMAPEEITSRFDISNYIAKVEATPERLRTAVGLGIRNFRTHTTMRVLCESLATFTALFETATTSTALDQILNKALAQYAAVWQFEYLFIPNAHEKQDPAPVENSWQGAALRNIRSLDLNSHRSVPFRQLAGRNGDVVGCWGCSIKPLGDRFSAAFALRQKEKPSALLLRELHTLLRTWALARESVLLKQVAAQEGNVRSEMHRERSDAIAQMVAGVAHEVNTPLGVANAAASMLQEVLAKPHFKALADNEEFTEDMDDALTSARLIQRNIARADELIRSFRQLSVRQLVDVREEVDFLACVQDAVTLYGPKAKRSGLQINVTGTMPQGVPKWLGYPGHLSQVILNLIGNAERYAYDGQAGVVDVLVSASEAHEVPEFRIVVRDYGNGIPQENLPHIFEAFFTTGRSKGGTGLGLSIVRNIVGSIFAGTITCESTVGEGTAFKLAFSHSRKQESAATAYDRPTDRVRIFEDFITLQRKLVDEGGTLSAEEQIQLAELRSQVDSFLAVQFKTDRRTQVRVPSSCPVTIAEDGWQDSTVVMLDLSERGAMLSFAREIEGGQRLRLSKIDQTAIALQLEIVTVDRLESDDGPRWHCGTRFTEVGAAAQRTLKLVMAQLMLDHWRTAS